MGRSMGAAMLSGSSGSRGKLSTVHEPCLEVIPPVKSPPRAALLAISACLLAAPAASAAPPSASFSFSPTSPYTLETVTFTSTSTGDITSQSWELDGDGSCNDATGPTAEHSFPTAGRYRVALCVAGPDGEAAQAQNIVVRNQEPIASLVPVPTKAKTGDPVTFMSTSKDPDGSIASQSWDLDADGEFDDGSEVSVSRTFLLPGTYEIALLVTDDSGAQTVTSEPVVIRARLLAPFPKVAIAGLVVSGGVRITEFEVDAPDDARVRIRCRGPGCPERSARVSRLRRIGRFERSLGVGAVVEVFVTRFGTIGKYTRFRVLEGEPPARRDLCVFPRGKRLRPCPSA
jgi:PKD repeat protein